DSYVVAQANAKLDEDGYFSDDEVIARFRGENTIVPRDKLDYMDVSPKQVVSAATACIPFLEHDDSNRALTGLTMRRQAVHLMESECPIVGACIEYVNGKDSGWAISCRNEGIVERIEAYIVHVRRFSSVDGKEVQSDLDIYRLQKYIRPNQVTC